MTNNVTSFVVHNGKQIDLTDVTTKSFAVLCDEMIEATESTYGSHIKIAAKLNDMLPFAWFDVTPEDLKRKATDDAKAMEPHWTALYAALKKAGHSNASVPGGRIREYGRNIRAGLAPNGKSMADGSPLPNNVSEGEGEGEGANPAKRSPMLRNVEDLVALYKHNDKLGKDAPAKVKAAQPHIVKALEALGVDVRTIK